MEHNRYRRDIDGLRSLAIVPVVLNHVGWGAPGGFVGVDIFFVISGYLISTILISEIDASRFSVVNFYERRVRRIFPALALLLFVVLIAGWFVLLPDEYLRLAQSALASLGFVSNIWFWRMEGDYFSPGVAFEPLLHTWSLAVEEQFYLVFPLLLLALARHGKQFRLAVVGGLCAASLLGSIWATRALPVANFYLAPTRLWELGLGVLVALGALPPSRRALVNEGVGLAGLALIVASIMLINAATPFPGAAALPPCLGTAAIIWSGSRQPTATGRLLSVPPLVGIGLISYSLYLWHWPILVAARLYEGSNLLALPVAAGCVALALIAAWASWRFVERPFRRRDGGLRLDQARLFRAAAFAAALLAAMGTVIIVSAGAPRRWRADTMLAYRRATLRSPVDVACFNAEIGAAACRLGAATTGAPPDYVIWGDSHAAALLPAFDHWLRARGKSGVAFATEACPPILNIRRVGQERGHGCDARNAAILRHMMAHHRGATVILVARWALATEGTRMAGEVGGPVRFVRAGATAAGNAALVEQGLDETLQALAANDNRIILLTQIPELGFDAPKVVAREALLGSAPPAPPRSVYDARNRHAHQLLAKVGARHGARLIETADELCTASCPFERDGNSLYRDDDHLSLFGAQQLFDHGLARDIEAVR